MPVEPKRRLERYLSEAHTVGSDLREKLGQLRAIAAGRHFSESHTATAADHESSEEDHLVTNSDRDSSQGSAKPQHLRRFSDLIRGSGGVFALSKWRTKVKSHHVKAMPEEQLPPLVRFRNYARLALICIRLCKYSHENVKASEDEYLSIMQLTDDYVPDDDGDMVFFDPRVFRANKEERLPTDARKILKRDPKTKTQKEIDYLNIVLRSIKAFAEYPSQMQRKLVRVGWYEAYEPKRAIVRQGQPPHAFYFILSGSVVVTSYDHVASATTFLVSLHKGMSFGELAVVNRSKRQATVSTATTTEFLCISAKDFVEIFMAGGIQSITDPDHNSFIRSIPFLKHWPVEALAENPQSCLFHYFGRGQVIVRDSNHSDWIYIVKSGSLSVMKQLVEVHPRTSQNATDSGGEDEKDSGKISRPFGTWQHRLRRKKRRESEEEKEVYRNQIEMEKRLENTLPGFHNTTERLGIIDYDEIIQEHKTRVIPNRRASMDVGLPKITVGLSALPENEEGGGGKSDVTDDSGDKDLQLPSIRRTSKHVVIKEPKDVKSSGSNFLSVPRVVVTSPKGAYLASKSHKKKSRKEVIQEELFNKQIEYDRKMNQSNTIGRKTITNELDNKAVKDYTLTEKDIRPMFVQVQVLEKGQYFGLTKSVFPEQATSFSVMSNGAECIMISKKFFFEKSSEATLHHLRQVETLLPPEDELQSGLQDFVDWKCHRSKVYARLVTDKHNRTVRHHQFPPSYAGQYCFRTGPIVRSSVV